VWRTSSNIRKIKDELERKIFTNTLIQ